MQVGQLIRGPCVLLQHAAFCVAICRDEQHDVLAATSCAASDETLDGRARVELDPMSAGEHVADGATVHHTLCALREGGPSEVVIIKSSSRLRGRFSDGHGLRGHQAHAVATTAP